MNDLVDRTKEAVEILNKQKSYAASIVGVQLEQAVRRHEKQYATLFDAVRVLMCEVDAHLGYFTDDTRMNQAAKPCRTILARIEGDQ